MTAAPFCEGTYQPASVRAAQFDQGHGRPGLVRGDEADADWSHELEGDDESRERDEETTEMAARAAAVEPPRTPEHGGADSGEHEPAEQRE